MTIAKFGSRLNLFYGKNPLSGQLYQRLQDDLERNAITAESAQDWLVYGMAKSGRYKTRLTMHSAKRGYFNV